MLWIDPGPHLLLRTAAPLPFSLREYVSGKVGDRVYPIPCPLPDCKAPISAAECGLVLTPEEQVTLGKVCMLPLAKV